MRSELKAMFKDSTYRNEVFRKTFLTDSGKLVLEYLQTVYTAPADFQNDRVTYYGMGKRDAIKEINHLIINKPKEKKNGA